MAKRLVIIDGYSLLFRAFFATRFLSTSDGRPTNALYGFTQMLFGIFEKEKPDALVVALDAPGKTFRHVDFVDYKGTRKETQPELVVQLEAARELIKELGIPSVEVVGFEADDVVGTISKEAESKGYETTIVTGDLDALQLVDDAVRVMTLRQGITDIVYYDPPAVIERMGVEPRQVPDFKALKGDTSDNIPGVAGIGDKGAAELIQKWDSVENLIDHLTEVEPKFLKKLAGNEDIMRLSKHLATIVRDVPLEYDFQPLQFSQAEIESAKDFLESYEFKSLAKRSSLILQPYLIGGNGPHVPIVEAVTEHIEAHLEKINEVNELKAFIAERSYALHVSQSQKVDLFGDEFREAYIAIENQVRVAPLELILPILFNSPQKAISFNAKTIWRTQSPNISGKINGKDDGIAASKRTPGFDAYLAASILQPGRTDYLLRDLVTGYLDVAAPESIEQLAVGLYQLKPVFTERLEKENQMQILQEVEGPLIPILAQMEAYGIQANRSDLKDFSKLLEEEIGKSQTKIYEFAGQEFLIGSPKQLGEILFDKLQIPGAKKNKSGYMTGVEILGEIADSYPIAAEVLNWRELSKLKSTYADSLERLIAEDGRIHTTYNQAGAATGRISSNDPNLQNIPIRTELGRPIRRAFQAAEGFKLASLDYSQIELRVLAHLCHEKALVEAFQNHEDVHSATAKTVFNLGDAEPTKAQRRQAKMLNYAVLYGVTGHGLARQLGPEFTIGEATELIKNYNERFPSVHGFTQEIVKEAKSKGFTTTMMGRRRYFPDIHAARFQERQYAERQAMNAPIQGAAADMLKLAMIDVSQLLIGKKSRMLLTVHDELVFEVSPDEEQELLPKIASAMENALPLTVPVEVDAKVGVNWDEMKKI